ncbi:MAG: aspartyl/asparaginyl beta-hydroxylase domain-containing protein [Myxococcota bacterium]
MIAGINLAHSALLLTLILITLVAVAAGYAFFRVRRMTKREKKLLLKRRLRHGWRWLEERGLVEKNPAMTKDYLRHYPELALLEENWELIQKECLALMELGDALPHIRRAGGKFTDTGIHRIEWTTFMFKSGRFLPENCRRAPETSALLRKIPGLSLAFFSILGPGQYIRPHWGYYKGFLRYHLGVVVPNNNADESCWIRVNDNRVAYDKRDRSVIEETEKYYWHEGEGILFDDTYLHDASNESDQPRAVLYLDLRKPLPWYLHYPNVLFIWLAHLDPSVREIREGAVMR